MIIAHISPRTAGKTTSVGWHAHALHERGYPVTALEADHSRQLAEWDVLAGGFPFPVQQQCSALFHKNVRRPSHQGESPLPTAATPKTTERSSPRYCEWPTWPSSTPRPRAPISTA